MARIIDDFEVERFYGSMEDCPDRTSDDTWRNPLDDEGAESFEPGSGVHCTRSDRQPPERGD